MHARIDRGPDIFSALTIKNECHPTQNLQAKHKMRRADLASELILRKENKQTIYQLMIDLR